MLLAALTLLPALLARARGARLLAGRRRGAARGPQPLGGGRRPDPPAPAPIWSLVFAGLLVLALGNLVHHGTIGFGQGETRPTELEPRHRRS